METDFWLVLAVGMWNVKNVTEVAVVLKLGDLG